MGYKLFELFATLQFREWLSSLADSSLKGRLLARLRRLESGQFGDLQPVGEGVSELRFHFGPGYRIYLVQRGPKIVILLYGGDKSSQVRDIKRAKSLLATLETALPWLN